MVVERSSMFNNSWYYHTVKKERSNETRYLLVLLRSITYRISCPTNGLSTLNDNLLNYCTTYYYCIRLLRVVAEELLLDRESSLFLLNFFIAFGTAKVFSV